MAITFAEIHDGRGGDANIDGEKTKTRVFRAIADNAATEDAAIIAALAVSAFGITFGTAHPDEPTCFAQRIRPENVSFSKKVWIVTVHYSNQAIANPVLEAAKIKWSTEKKSALVVIDYNGDVICNSAGMLYDPPPEYDDEIDIVRVTKNVSVMPAWWPNGYRRTQNSDVFSVDGLSVPIGTARMVDRSLSDFKEKSGIPYRELEFTLAIDPAGWDLTLLDSGFAELNPLSPTGRTKIVLDDGTEPSQPFPLNGSGNKLANPGPSTLVTRTHVIYAPVIYGTLPLT